MAICTETLNNVVNDELEGDFNLLFPEYNLFDDEHKDELQKKIFDHYRFREIGFETTERFIHEFKTKLLEIIPLANLYYESMANEKLKQLYNWWRKKNYTRNKNGNKNDGNYSTSNTANNTFNDTPYSSYPSNSNYSTTTNKNTSSGTTKHDKDAVYQDTEIYNDNEEGFNGMTPAEAIKKYMDVLMDVDMWIIDNLNELFMGVY